MGFRRVKADDRPEIWRRLWADGCLFIAFLNFPSFSYRIS